MYKYLILLLLFTLTLQQVSIQGRIESVAPNVDLTPPEGSSMVGYSGDGDASIQLLDGRPSDIGETTSASYSTRSSIETAVPNPTATMQVDVKHENEASWIYPKQTGIKPSSSNELSLSISPPWRWARYDFNFYTECPQVGAWIWVNAPGYTWLLVNGNLVSGGFWPYPGGRWVFISSIYLRCGCNNVRIYVWGIYPWLTYGLWLPPQNCAEKCEATGLAFYNRRQCRCECLRLCCKEGFYRSSYLPCQCLRSIIGIATDFRATTLPGN